MFPTGRVVVVDVVDRRDVTIEGLAPAAHSPRGATQHTVREALADGRALTAGEIAGTTGLQRPTIAATLSNPLPDARHTAEDSAAGAPGGEESAPTRGADRALQELRSELTAALRTSRS